MFYRAAQHVGQDFHVFMRVGAKTLPCVDHVFVDHPQRREAHKIGIVIVGKGEGVPAIQPTMIGMTTIFCLT
ncbi:hypothetical protein D3C72_2340620 [compost metagenome]